VHPVGECVPVATGGASKLERVSNVVTAHVWDTSSTCSGSADHTATCKCNNAGGCCSTRLADGTNVNYNIGCPTESTFVGVGFSTDSTCAASSTAGVFALEYGTCEDNGSGSMRNTLVGGVVTTQEHTDGACSSTPQTSRCTCDTECCSGVDAASGQTTYHKVFCKYGSSSLSVPSSGSPASSSDATGAIAGGVAGGVVVLAAGVVCAMLYAKKRRSDGGLADGAGTQTPQGAAAAALTNAALTKNPTFSPSDSQVRLDRNNSIELNPITRGGSELAGNSAV